MDTGQNTRLLLRAVEIGGHLVRIAESLDEPDAANHLSAGLEILRVRAELARDLRQSLWVEPETAPRADAIG